MLVLADVCAGGTRCSCPMELSSLVVPGGLTDRTPLVSRTRVSGHFSQLSSPCMSHPPVLGEAMQSRLPGVALRLPYGGGHGQLAPDRQAGTAVVFRTKALFTSVQCCIMQMCSLVSPIKGFLVQYCIVPHKPIHIPTDIPGKL